jgi:hypothetical protein
MTQRTCVYLDSRDRRYVGGSGFPGLIMTVPGELTCAWEINLAGKMLARGTQVLGLIGGFDAEPMVQQDVDPPWQTAEPFGSGAEWLPG